VTTAGLLQLNHENFSLDKIYAGMFAANKIRS
jgi:hypothetical protein